MPACVRVNGMIQNFQSCIFFYRINDASVSYCRGVTAVRAHTVLKQVKRTKIILHNVKLYLYSMCLRWY